MKTTGRKKQCSEGIQWRASPRGVYYAIRFQIRQRNELHPTSHTKGLDWIRHMAGRALNDAWNEIAGGRRGPRDLNHQQAYKLSTAPFLWKVEVSTIDPTAMIIRQSQELLQSQLPLNERRTMYVANMPILRTRHRGKLIWNFNVDSNTFKTTINLSLIHI